MNGRLTLRVSKIAQTWLLFESSLLNDGLRTLPQPCVFSEWEDGPMKMLELSAFTPCYGPAMVLAGFMFLYHRNPCRIHASLPQEFVIVDQVLSMFEGPFG